MAKAFSAPGKALLAGGYLVLDPKYKSYVVALSSRMHAVVNREASEKFEVTVTSSQFNNDKWTYTVERNSVSNYDFVEINNLRNPFIEKVIVNVFNYFSPELPGMNIQIDIFSDNGYHSQDQSITKTNGVRSFNFHKETITKVPKTGLGSSAGLVTVVTTALTSCFIDDFDISDSLSLNVIHNLAQTSHCQAQGKVGSGFDVAAATFGSILYKRFSPELINDLPDYKTSSEYASKLKNLISEANWGILNDRISLPEGFRLIMGDVNSGSETTKLVAKVKEWYQRDPVKGLEIYTKINEGNMEFIEALESLNKLSREEPVKYENLVKSVDENKITAEVLVRISDAILKVRENFRIITKESGAEIEPEVQSLLLDNAVALPGVLTGMIPGAGGYDAISLITTTNCEIEKLTAGHAEFANVTYLDLTQEDVGVKEENPAHYENLN